MVAVRQVVIGRATRSKRASLRAIDVVAQIPIGETARRTRASLAGHYQNSTSEEKVDNDMRHLSFQTLCSIRCRRMPESTHDDRGFDYRSSSNDAHQVYYSVKASRGSPRPRPFQGAKRRNTILNNGTKDRRVGNGTVTTATRRVSLIISNHRQHLGSAAPSAGGNRL